MEPKQYYIGIDVGGTSVKEGLFDEDGNLLAKASTMRYSKNASHPRVTSA